MRTHNLLYYPDFYPDPVWLRRVLLLADSITRIVPAEVRLDDPIGLAEIQESIPGSLLALSPETRDVEIQNQNLPRLAKAFSLLSRKRKRSKKTINVVFHGGSISVAGHVFLHNAKLSHVVREELERNRLVIEGLGELAAHEDYLLVDEEASNLILSLIAERISRRTGLDAITDKPIPFGFNAISDVQLQTAPLMGGAEGAVLAALTAVLIPADVSKLSAKDYLDLRESYSSIRIAFSELTVQLAEINRLNRIEDPKRFRTEVESTVDEFAKEHQRFRTTKYARNFKRWVPFYVGGILTIAGALVSPHIAVGIAGASMAIQVVQRGLDLQIPDKRDSVFHMLASLQKNIVRRSRIRELI